MTTEMNRERKSKTLAEHGSERTGKVTNFHATNNNDGVRFSNFQYRTNNTNGNIALISCGE